MGGHFTYAQTLCERTGQKIMQIINEKAFEHLDSNIKIKLIKLNMDVYYDVLSRNLKVLL